MFIDQLACCLLTSLSSLRSAQSSAGQDHVEHFQLQGHPEMGPGARFGERVRGYRIQGRNRAKHEGVYFNSHLL